MAFSRKFIDTKKREWPVTFTIGTMMRVEMETGITLDDLVPKPGKKHDDSCLEPFQAFISDGMTIFKVMWAIFKPDCEAKGITLQDFADGFGEETFLAAGRALVEALHDFFPSPLRKTMLLQMLTKGQKAMEIAAKRLNQEMEKADVEKAVNQEMDRVMSQNEASLNGAFVSPAA